ncbi:hypothetical protein [Schlesneria sp.]|uniref:hypothetical protein n=1 Tax=Schlesneria sp. TaxID=2762018 RepID=UPI002F0F1647
MSDRESSLLKALNSMLPPETIGGHDVHDAAQCVDLNVEFTPVLPDRIEDPATTFPRLIPTPRRVQMDGSRWCVWLPNTPEKYRWVNSDDELKVMRARYLLLRGWYFERIETMSHSQRAEVIGKYFPGGVFKPACLMQPTEK